MAEICNENLHKAQKRLHKTMVSLEAMRIECCNTGQCEERDKLGMIMSHLHAANSIGGGLCMKDENDVTVEPLSGGK